MNKFAKVFLGSSILFAATSAFATNYTNLLTDYKYLAQAVEEGHDVRAIVHFDKCQPSASNRNAAYPASTRINFNIFGHYKVVDSKGERYAIATSNTILTEHRAFGPVYAYARLRVFEDNTAEFHDAYFEPNTYVKKGSADYQCRIDNGGVVLVDAGNAS